MNRPLRIGIDGSFLSGKARGHAHYAHNLCQALDRLLPQAQFFVYSPIEMKLPVQPERWYLRIGGQWLAPSPVMWLKLFAHRLIKPDRLDVFWGTYYFLPRLPHSVRTILMVHDFAYQITPGTLPRSHALAFHLFLKSDIKRTDAVMSCSQATADRIFQFSGRTASVITPGIRDIYRPQSDGQIKECLQHFGIEPPYLLNVATWEPRKNVELLAKTVIRMKNKGLMPNHQLILVGKKGWRYEQLEAMVNQHKFIRWLDYVLDAYLPPLYSGADLFVFPSLYEGFGMPVLEARACGTRAVVTDIPELREAGGVDTIYTLPTMENLEAAILDGLIRKSEPLNLSYLPTWVKQGCLLRDLILKLVA